MPTSSITSGSDHTLLAAFVSAHDQQAFADLVAKHAALVHATCRRRLGDSMADDAAQAVFLLLARRAPTLLRTGQPIAPWLFTVAGLVARNHLRTEARRRAREQAAMPPTTHHDGDDAWADVRAHLDVALDEVPEHYRTTLVMHYLDGVERGDLGPALGITAEAVKKRMQRGLDLLRQALSRRGVAVPAVALIAALPLARAEALTHQTLAQSVTAAVPAGAASSTAVALTHGAFPVMLLAAAITIPLTLTIAAIAGGVWLMNQPVSGGHSVDPPVPVTPAPLALAPQWKLKVGDSFWYVSLLQWTFTADPSTPNVIKDVIPEQLTITYLINCTVVADAGTPVGSQRLFTQSIVCWRPAHMFGGTFHPSESNNTTFDIHDIQVSVPLSGSAPFITPAYGDVVLDLSMDRVQPVGYTVKERDDYGPVLLGLGFQDMLQPVPTSRLVPGTAVAMPSGLHVTWHPAPTGQHQRLVYGGELSRDIPNVLTMDHEVMGVPIKVVLDASGRGRTDVTTLFDEELRLPVSTEEHTVADVTLKTHQVDGPGQALVRGKLDIRRSAFRVTDAHMRPSGIRALPAVATAMTKPEIQAQIATWIANPDPQVANTGRVLQFFAEHPPTVTQTPATTEKISIQGTVTAVSEAANGSRPESIVLGVGQSSGVQPGAEFIIYHDNHYICKVRIEQVLTDTSQARIIPTSWNSKDLQIQQGDQAASFQKLPESKSGAEF